MNDALFDVDEPIGIDWDAYDKRVSAANRLRDLDRARAERDEAMARADEHADTQWRIEAERIVFTYAQRHTPFTSDDVMDALDAIGLVAHEPRALGPVMNRAIRSQWIERTGYVQSRRRHASPIAQYRGLL